MFFDPPPLYPDPDAQDTSELGSSATCTWFVGLGASLLFFCGRQYEYEIGATWDQISEMESALNAVLYPLGGVGWLTLIRGHQTKHRVRFWGTSDRRFQD
jgi:hypothetical protein